MTPVKLNRLELIISVSLILVIAVGGFLSGNVMMAMGTAKEDPSQAIESPTQLIGLSLIHLYGLSFGRNGSGKRIHSGAVCHGTGI